MELRRIEIDDKLWELFHIIEKAIDDNTEHKCIQLNKICDLSDELYELVVSSEVFYR